MNSDPLSHLIPGTRAAVDYFRGPHRGTPGKYIYFLSHFHGDHYGGLNENCSELLYCSPITASLVVSILNVDKKWVVPIEFNTPTRFSLDGDILPEDEQIGESGFTVTLLDANHCPGAAMLLFEVHNASTGTSSSYLHVGDMRYHTRMKHYPELIAHRQKLNAIYLDTTYAHPKHVFPPQQESVNLAIECVKETITNSKSNPLVLISAYTIGKERIVFGVAAHFGWKVYANSRKKTILELIQLDDTELDMLTDDPLEAQIHIVNMSVLGELFPYYQANFEGIRMYLEQNGVETASNVVGILPSGWAMASNYNKRNSVKSQENVTVHLVPYSEHSNFAELIEFVRFLKPVKVVPTVFSNDNDKRNIQDRFRNCVNVKAAKRAFFAAFGGDASSLHKKVNVSSTDSSLGLLQSSATKSDMPIRSEIEVIDCGITVDKQRSIVIEIVSDEEDSLQKHTAQSNSDHKTCSPQKHTAQSNSDHKTCSPQKHTAQSNSDHKTCSPTKHTAQSNSDRNVPCDNCTLLNKKGASACAACGKQLRSKGTARGCRKCTFINKVGTVECAMCGDKLSSSKTLMKQSPTKSTLGDFFTRRTTNVSPKINKKKVDKDQPVSPNVSHAGSVQFLHNNKAQSDDKTKVEQDASYTLLTDTLEKVANTTKRLEKQQYLVDLFATLLRSHPNQLIHAVYLCTDSIAPKFSGGDYSVGIKTLANAVSHATGVSRDQMRSMYKERGDFGDVARDCQITKQTYLVNPQPLTITGVYETLVSLSTMTGSGSVSRKRNVVESLLRRCAFKSTEIRFMVRTLCRNIRIGASKLSILQALAIAQVRVFQPKQCSSQSISEQQVHCNSQQLGNVQSMRDTTTQEQRAEQAVKNAFAICPDFGKIVECLNDPNGIERIEQISLQPGIPVEPMLAKVCHGMDEFLVFFKDHHKFTCEYKYDGQRIQIHGCDIEYHNGTISSRSAWCFSRHCDDSTQRFPDAIEATLRAGTDAKVKSFVLDAEVVAVELHEEINEARNETHSQCEVHPIVVQQQLEHCGPNFEPQLRPAQDKPIGVSTTAGHVTGSHVGFNILPFQSLSTRARPSQTNKQNSIAVDHQSNLPSAQVSICVFAFDLLFLNGESLLNKTLEDRRLLLKKHFKEVHGKFHYAAALDIEINQPICEIIDEVQVSETSTTSSNLTESQTNTNTAWTSTILAQVRGFFQSALNDKCEGLMAKALDSSPYEPSIRSSCWVKLKQDYLNSISNDNNPREVGFTGGGLADTLDLIPMGGWNGNGRKAGWISPILLGCWNSETQEVESVCRCMSGITNEDYKKLTAYYLGGEELETERLYPRKPSYYITDEAPTYWFRPSQVWEMRGAELTLSPVHKAAVYKVSQSRGISMRFPRFVRIRDDKVYEEATTSERIAELYTMQTRRHGTNELPSYST